MVTGKKILLRIGACLAHAVFMILLCWGWMGVNYTLELEEIQIKASTLIEQALFEKRKNFAEEFVFIDISGNKSLLDREDGSGSDIITDRNKLNTFFKQINRVSKGCYKYIICDVLFDRSSIDDKQLEETLYNTPKLIIPASETDEGIQLPVFKSIQSGIASYPNSFGYASSESIIKYTLLEKQGRSIALAVHENLVGKKCDCLLGLLFLNNKTSFNCIFPNYRIQSSHLINDSGRSRIIPLNYISNLLAKSETFFFNNLLKDKYIVIGDFVNDTHSTTLGPMSGPVILSNIYLSVREGDNLIKISWLLYVMVGFGLVSSFFLYPPEWLLRLEEWLIHSSIGVLLFIEELFMAAFLLWLVSLGSYLVCGIHLDIVVLSLYMTAFITIKKVVWKIKNADI